MKGRRVVVFVTSTLLFLCMKVNPAISAYASPSLRLHNIPHDATFYVNGIMQPPDAAGRIPVPSGPLLLEIKQYGVVVYSSSFFVDSMETKTITFHCSEDCALLHVVTEPPGATISINGTILGMTPYMNRFIKPGIYSLMVTAPGYFPVIRRINLTMQSEIESYVMEQTRAVKDSLWAVKKSLQHKRQIKNGTLLGVAGIGMSAAGVYYEWKAYRFLKKMDYAGQRYDIAVNDDECERQKRIYYDNRDNAKRPILYRNIFYITAGFFLAGSYITLNF